MHQKQYTLEGGSPPLTEDQLLGYVKNMFPGKKVKINGFKLKIATAIQAIQPIQKEEKMDTLKNSITRIESGGSLPEPKNPLRLSDMENKIGDVLQKVDRKETKERTIKTLCQYENTVVAVADDDTVWIAGPKKDVWFQMKEPELPGLPDKE